MESQYIAELTEKGMTDRGLGERLRKSPSTVRNYRTRGLPVETSVKVRGEIIRVCSEELDSPLSPAACDLVASFRYTIDKKCYEQLDAHRYLIEQYLLPKIPTIANKSEFSGEDLECVMVTFYWIFGIKLSDRREHRESDLRNRWNQVRQLLLRILQSRNDDNQAGLLKFNYEFNINIAVRWNTTPATKRSSKEFRHEMIDVLKEMDYFNKVESVNDKFPYHLPVPYGALAISSRLQLPGKHQSMSEQYYDLGSRIARASQQYADNKWIVETHKRNTTPTPLGGDGNDRKPRGRPPKSDDTSLDSDMDGFVEWIKKNDPKLLERWDR